MRLRIFFVVGAIVLGAVCLVVALGMQSTNDDQLQDAQAQQKNLAEQKVDIDQDQLATAASNRDMGTQVDHTRRAYTPVILTMDALRFQTTKRLEYLQRMETAAKNGNRSEVQTLLNDDVTASQQAFVDALNKFVAEHSKPIVVTNR